MLSLLVGRSRLERGKAMGIVILAGLLGLSLWQLSVGHAQAVRGNQDRQAVADIAGRFAIAMTTYDYVHPGVQASQVAPLSSASVRARLAASSEDAILARASSLGAVTYTAVVSATTSRAEVLLGVSQVVSGTYVTTGSQLAGLLDVALSRTVSGWIVTDYRWLLAPGTAP